MIDTSEYKKPKRGRPVGSGKIKPMVVEALVKNIEAGVTIKAACQRSGIAQDTFYRWKKKGENARSGNYKEFSEAIDKAKANCLAMLEMTATRSARPHDEVREKEVIDPKTGEIITLKEIKKGVVDSQMARFLLERRHPELYGRKDKIDLTTGGNPFEVPIFGTAMGQGESEDRD